MRALRGLGEGRAAGGVAPPEDCRQRRPSDLSSVAAGPGAVPRGDGGRVVAKGASRLVASLALAVRAYWQIVSTVLSVWLSQHGVPQWLQSIAASSSLLWVDKKQQATSSSARTRCRYGFYRTLESLHSQASPSKLTVVLDLDDTLICSFRKEVTPYRLLHGLGTNNRLRCHEIPIGPGGEIPASSPSSLMVFERPGLTDFLKELKNFAEVVIFTAGTEDYAAPILQRIDPARKLFDAVLFRDSTVTVQGVENAKDLTVIGRPLATTVLVDNSALSFLPQPDNGIPAQEYSGSPTDKHLLGVLLPLLQDLSTLDDVRPILAQKYMVERYLKNQGQMVLSQSQ